MKLIFLITLTTAITSQALSQYCMSGGPTSTIDSNIESVTLVGESGSINYTGCPGVLGVEIHSSETVFLDAGSNYTANIQFGTCGGSFSGVGEAWIDFNNDGIFSPSESIGTWTGMPPTAVSNFTFNVPFGAPTGLTKMRVIQGENLSMPINPCASFTWGSATDFNVYIQNGVDCSGYIGDDFTNPRLVNSFPFSEIYDNSVCYTNQNLVYNSPDVFYRIIPSPGMTSVLVSLCGSAFDTFLTVLDENMDVIAINDDNISCGTQSEILVSTIGHDTLFAIVEGWGSTSGEYTINISQGTLSVSAIENSKHHIYPNPSKDVFVISESYEGMIRIVDLNGQTIRTQNVNPNDNIDVSNLDSGIYFIYLNDDSNYKLIKL